MMVKKMHPKTFGFPKPLFFLQRKIRVISVFTPPALCPADPSRVVVAPLGEVWACPAAVALRARLSQHLQDLDVAHRAVENFLKRRGAG